MLMPLLMKRRSVRYPGSNLPILQEAVQQCHGWLPVPHNGHEDWHREGIGP
jgi:hypothetical protein